MYKLIRCSNVSSFFSSIPFSPFRRENYDGNRIFVMSATRLRVFVRNLENLFVLCGTGGEMALVATNYVGATGWVALRSVGDHDCERCLVVRLVHMSNEYTRR